MANCFAADHRAACRHLPTAELLRHYAPRRRPECRPLPTAGRRTCTTRGARGCVRRKALLEEHRQRSSCHEHGWAWPCRCESVTPRSKIMPRGCRRRPPGRRDVGQLVAMVRRREASGCSRNLQQCGCEQLSATRRASARALTRARPDGRSRLRPTCQVFSTNDPQWDQPNVHILPEKIFACGALLPPAAPAAGARAK